MHKQTLFGIGMKDIAALCRIRIACAAGAASAFGYLLFAPVPDGRLGAAVAGTMLLAAGCSAWNQTQEKATDALMERTKNRPIARGALSPGQGAALGLVLVLAAATVFSLLQGARGAALACLIVVVYNLCYTPLKKHTCSALLIGASAGAAPPLVGWSAAGGSLADPLAAVVYGVFLLWQIPHFWLRAERNTEDYRKAGLPVPALLYPPARYTRLMRLWCCAFAAGLLLLAAFPFLHNSMFRAALSALGIGLFAASGLLPRRTARAYPEQTSDIAPDGQACRAVPRRAASRPDVPWRMSTVLLDGTFLAVLALMLADRI